MGRYEREIIVLHRAHIIRFLYFIVTHVISAECTKHNTKTLCLAHMLLSIMALNAIAMCLEFEMRRQVPLRGDINEFVPRLTLINVLFLGVL